MNKAILLLLLFNFSCKSDNKTKLVDKSITIEKELEVVISAIVLSDDVFEVYYYEPGTENFNSNDFVEAKVTGSNNIQDINFTFPFGVFPERLRLDFGKNINQEDIQLKGVKIISGTKEYVFSNEEIANEFKPSKYIIFDKQALIIKTQSIDNKYDPYFYTIKVNNIINFLLED